MVNRAVLIIRYKQPFADWINAVDPNPRHTITLDDANQDTTAYLVDVEDEHELDRWLKRNALALFEEELNNWYIDPDLWPRKRSAALFKKWCTLELHTVVEDTGGRPIADDEA